MPYFIETYDAGGPIDRLFVVGTEQEAIQRAQSLRTGSNISLIRVIRVEFQSDDNGPEVWSERRGDV